MQSMATQRRISVCISEDGDVDLWLHLCKVADVSIMADARQHLQGGWQGW